MTLKRRLAAVMFTDMVGYTGLMHRDEAAALRSRARHRKALEESLEDRGGKVLQYFGDGSLSIFDSSVEAVEAAIAIQRALDGDPLLRIGLHSGDIAFDVQGAYGDAVNIAARLEARCTPGGVTISQVIYEDIRRHPELKVVSCGTVPLKHIPEPVLIYALAVEGLRTPEEAGPAPGTTPRSADDLPASLLERLDELSRQPWGPRGGVGALIGRVPLVGRETELDAMRAALDRAEAGQSSSLFVRGARGVGKTRLSWEMAEEARARGWTVLQGRAHPSERRVPYAPFSDAFMPLLRGLDPATLVSLTPGQDAALCELFPALGPAPEAPDLGPSAPGEPRTRLYWQFAALLARLAAHRPLLLILEDLDFADRASLELLGFVARQCAPEAIVFVGEYAGTDPDSRRVLRELEQSLIGKGTGRVFELGALDGAGSAEFVRRAFELDPGEAAGLTEVVHRWAGGNPFLLAGTLRGLVERGVLRRTEGGWSVGELGTIALPTSVRDAVVVWTASLSEAAGEVAGLLAVIGRDVPYEVIRHLAGLDDATLGPALDELVRYHLLVESETRWSLTYAFRNPLIRETLRSEFPLSRRRELHGLVAERLEAYYGDDAAEHADELAYHYGRTHPGGARGKALRYLYLAGETALRRHANQEARDYLQEAADLAEAMTPARGTGDDAGPDAPSGARILTALARARRRCGDMGGSVALWRRLLARAREGGRTEHVGALLRQVGLTYLAGGAFEEAVEEFAAAAEWAEANGDVSLVIRSQLAEAFCYQSIGRPDRAEEVVDRSLELAEAHGDPGLLGQVHRTRVQHNMWTGHLDVARDAAERALELSRASGDRSVEFWSLWARAAMEGLSGQTREMSRLVDACGEVAREVGSPFFELATSELRVELAYARGEWDEGLALGRKAVDLARSADEALVRPRLLVWISLIHLGRGNHERADALTREAWEVSGAARADDPATFVDLHTVVPAHIGRAAYALATRDWETARQVAEAGLRIADRSGYVVWAIHHILPMMAEAAIEARDLERAREVGQRMRQEADRMGHALGIAWADACEALLTWLSGDAEIGARSLRKGAEALESIPLMYEASRLRRQLGGQLLEIGDLEGARTELQRAAAVLERLGATPELEKTRRQMQEVAAAAAQQQAR